MRCTNHNSHPGSPTRQALGQVKYAGALVEWVEKGHTEHSARHRLGSSRCPEQQQPATLRSRCTASQRQPRAPGDAQGPQHNLGSQNVTRLGHTAMHRGGEARWNGLADDVGSLRGYGFQAHRHPGKSTHKTRLRQHHSVILARRHILPSGNWARCWLGCADINKRDDGVQPGADPPENTATTRTQQQPHGQLDEALPDALTVGPQ